MRVTGIFLLGAILTLGISGCRQDEQDRPLSYDKGVYNSDQTGTALTPEQQQDLRRRVRQQASSGL